MYRRSRFCAQKCPLSESCRLGRRTPEKGQSVRVSRIRSHRGTVFFTDRRAYSASLDSPAAESFLQHSSASAFSAASSAFSPQQQDGCSSVQHSASQAVSHSSPQQPASSAGFSSSVSSLVPQLEQKAASRGILAPQLGQERRVFLFADFFLDDLKGSADLGNFIAKGGNQVAVISFLDHFCVSRDPSCS